MTKPKPKLVPTFAPGLVRLDGPWGVVALRPAAVTSLRGANGGGEAQTHIGLPSGEVPVHGTLEEVARELGLTFR